MKKKILLLFLMIICTFTLVGCGSSKKENKENEKEEEKIADDEVILENIKYKLDQDDSEYGISYKIANNFRKTSLINAINYFSEKINGSSYFVIRIYQYPGKDIEYAIKDSVETVENREVVIVGDKEYTKVYFTNYNGAKTHLYYYTSNNITYTFVFTADIDLSRLEDIFLKNIKY